MNDEEYGVIDDTFDEDDEERGIFVDKTFDFEKFDDNSLDNFAMSTSEVNARQGGLMFKLLPQDLDAEMGILGTLINKPELLGKALNEGIRNFTFYREAHNRIWSAITSLKERTDVRTLASNLKKYRILSDVGGYAYLDVLKKMGKNPSEFKLKAHCESVMESYKRRMLIRVGTIIVEDSYKDDTPINDYLKKAISKLVEYIGADRSMYSHKTEINNLTQNLEERVNQGKRFELSTGYDPIDDITYGLRPGWLWVVGARTHVGKTSFILNLMDNVVKQGNSSLLFSYDALREEVLIRLLSKYAGINSDRFFDTAKLEKQDFEKIKKAAESLYGRNIVIDDRNPSLDNLKERIEREQKFSKPSLIIIDPLQAFDTAQYKTRADSLGEVVRYAKQAAKDTRATVVFTSQLTRKVDERKDKMPRKLTDFKDCGVIEEEADIATALYRPEAYWPEEDKYKGWMNFIFLKHRYGEISKTIKLGFNKETGEIKPYDKKTK